MLSQKQAGFRRDRSTVNQVTLIQEISSLQYCLALRPHLQTLTPPTRQAHGIFHHAAWPNRSFTITTGGNGPQKRFWRLKNSVPQKSVMAPFLLNIYIHDSPKTTSRKFAYADVLLAIRHSAHKWQTLEGTLNQDRANLSIYLQSGNWSSVSQKQWQQLSISTTRKQDVN